MSIELDVDVVSMREAFDLHQAFGEARIQRAMLVTTRRGAERLKNSARMQMAAAGLGRLGDAYGTTSDQERRGAVYPQPDGFSASGMAYVRTRSERTRGALASYTQGADIRPTRGRFLWIPTKDIPARASDRFRLSPESWVKSGLDRRIGPLVLIHSVNGLPLLVVKNASVSAEGKARSAKSRTKTGKLKKGQVAREFLVAFIGVPRTSRAARVDVNAIHAAVMAELPDIFAREFRKA